jgi:hypothetical protein
MNKQNDEYGRNKELHVLCYGVIKWLQGKSKF